MVEEIVIVPLVGNSPTNTRFYLSYINLPQEITPDHVHTYWLEAKDRNAKLFKFRGYLVKIRDVVYHVKPGKKRTSEVTKI